MTYAVLVWLNGVYKGGLIALAYEILSLRNRVDT